MTRVVGDVYVAYQDGTSDSLGTVEYLLDIPYDEVNDLTVFNKVKADYGYRLENGMLELMGYVIPASSIKKVGVRLVLKERLD